MTFINIIFFLEPEASTDVANIRYKDIKSWVTAASRQDVDDAVSTLFKQWK